MCNFYCYIHKRKDGTPFYVGKGSKDRAFSFSQRSIWHKNIVAKEGGKENILVEVYQATDEANAFLLEKLFIKGLSLFFTLCNLTDGGDGPSGITRTLETKNKISKAVSGKNHPNFGKSLPEATKIKIGLANKGKKRSAEFRKFLSDINTGKTHKVSKEVREHLSKVNSVNGGSGAKISWNEVIQIRDLYAHGIMSQRNLAKEYGLCRTQIIHILRYHSWKTN